MEENGNQIKNQLLDDILNKINPDIFVLQEKAKTYINNVIKIKQSQKEMESHINNLSLNTIRENMHTDTETVQQYLNQQSNFQEALHNFLNKTILFTIVTDDGKILYGKETAIANYVEVNSEKERYRADINYTNIVGQEGKNDFQHYPETLIKKYQTRYDERLNHYQNVYKAAQNRLNKNTTLGQARQLGLNEEKILGYLKRHNLQKTFWWVKDWEEKEAVEKKFGFSRKELTSAQLGEAYVAIVWNTTKKINNNETLEKQLEAFSDFIDSISNNKSLKNNLPGFSKGDVEKVAQEYFNKMTQFAVKTKNPFKLSAKMSTGGILPSLLFAYIISSLTRSELKNITRDNIQKIINLSEKYYTNLSKQGFDVINKKIKEEIGLIKSSWIN